MLQMIITLYRCHAKLQNDIVFDTTSTFMNSYIETYSNYLPALSHSPKHCFFVFSSVLGTDNKQRMNKQTLKMHGALSKHIKF